MDSISSLVKKHCRCGVNIICALLLTIHSILSTIQAIMICEPAYIVGCAVLIAITISCWIYVFGFKIGCTLLRIPLIIMDLFSFFIALLLSALGVVFISHNEAESYINKILTEYGYERLAITPYALGIVLAVAGILFFALSFCLLAGVRYFGSIRKCLDGEVKRNGAKVFGISAIILFVFLTIITIFNTASMIMNHRFYTVISSFPSNIIYINLCIETILLLFVGISANSFSNKTYAFKVFENQMMKVESNADGTVYVPINEENETTFGNRADEASVNLPTSFDTTPIKPQSANADISEKHKPYIKEGQVDIPKSDKKPKPPMTSTGESDII